MDNKTIVEKSKDGLLARGSVDIQIFKNGKLIDRISDNNLVVTLGKKNIAELLGGTVTGVPITTVGVGENGVAPAPGDNALTNSFTKAVDSVSHPTANQVMFHFDIDNAEANGKTIREFGLLNANGVLCARKIRGEDIVKTNAIRLVGTWTITIN